jgi:hypothetical protein
MSVEQAPRGARPVNTQFGQTGQFLGESTQPGRLPNPHISEAGWWFRPVGSGTNSTDDMPGFGERRSNMNEFITDASIISNAAKTPLHSQKEASRAARANETYLEAKERQKKKYEQRRLAAGEQEMHKHANRMQPTPEYDRYKRKRKLEKLAFGKDVAFTHELQTNPGFAANRKRRVDRLNTIIANNKKNGVFKNAAKWESQPRSLWGNHVLLAEDHAELVDARKIGRAHV